VRYTIKSKVKKLTKKHKTSNPFEIAEAENIIVIFEPLGDINGYYNKYVRQRFIHINSKLDRFNKLFTGCHELGHAILHPDANTPFLRQSTFFSVNRFELEANLFAAELLISDADLKKYYGTGYSISQIASELKVSEPLVEYKVRNTVNFF